MTQLTEEERLQKAIWRYDVISPLLREGLPRGSLTGLLRELAGRFYVNEHKEVVRLSERTLERYLARYRQDGLAGLKPAMRPEHSSLKAFSYETLDAAVALRLKKPELSADSIITILQRQGLADARRITVSTLNRHFRRLSHDRLSLKRRPRKRRHLLMVDGMHQLWIGDVWDGPLFSDPASGQRRRLRLMAILDSHTRTIAHAEFYYQENLPALEDTLLKAILKHGLPERLYVDNAKIFHSKHLKRIAAELGFRLQHTKVYQPQGRGKLERWFRTVAEKFQPLLEAAVEAGKLADLVAVNQFLLAWVDTYHNRRHGSLKKSPAQAAKEAWQAGQVLSRPVEPQLVKAVFLWREKRLVTSLATVKVFGNQYEVDASLIGRQVEIRYNPYDLRQVWVYDEGESFGKAQPYQMKRFTDKRVQPRQETAAQALAEAAEAIVAEHGQKSGVSFARALEDSHE